MTTHNILKYGGNLSLSACNHLKSEKNMSGGRSHLHLQIIIRENESFVIRVLQDLENPGL